VEELGRVAREGGARVLFGEGSAHRRASCPWMGALEGYTASIAEPDAAGRALVHIAPARFPDALTRWLLDVSARSAVLVVLDDLDRADAVTIASLRTIAPAAREARLLVVGTLEEHSRRTRELEAAGAESAHLEALDVSAVATFAERLLGGALRPRILSEVMARTRGNALLVRELLRLLDDEGWLGDEEQAVAAVRSWRRVNDVIRRRIARLSGPCRRLVELAAAQGYHFDVGVLRERAGDETEGFLDRLDEAERAAVVGPSPWRPGYYRFAHPLVAGVAQSPREA
jgi:predicted ATPase